LLSVKIRLRRGSFSIASGQERSTAPELPCNRDALDQVSFPPRAARREIAIVQIGVHHVSWLASSFGHEIVTTGMAVPRNCSWLCVFGGGYPNARTKPYNRTSDDIAL
jgi:hypothetical protein